MFLLKRSSKKELIDLGPDHYTTEEYDDCLNQLDKVGHFLGGDRASFKAFKNFSFTPKNILDVGCGGGGFTKKMAQRFSMCQVTGIDINSTAVAFAQKVNSHSHVTFKCCDLKSLPSKSYDVVMTTLVCHHLTDQELIPFLQECLRVARKKVIINDLHRNIIAYVGYSLIAPLLFHNRLITHDGKLSILRSFKRNDLINYMKELKTEGKISWCWPFRWILTLEVK